METDPDVIKANLETADENLAKENPGPNVPREKIEGGMRTYATDIAEMMKREKGSIIKIALAEQKRRDEFKQKSNPVATKNIIVILLGIVLIVGGIMVFVYSVLNRSKPVDITNVSPSLPSFVFSENQVHIDMTDLNRTELIDSIHDQVANDTQVSGTINNLFTSYTVSGTQIQAPSTVFLQKIGVDIPESLFQNLQPTFMLGIFNRPEKNELFVIFRVKDFNEAFLSMREWESTMLSELVRLFKIDTSAYGRAIFSREFVTETMYNKETRLLRDEEGKVLLSYMFLDPNTLMITTAGISFEEIVKRINLQTLK